MPHIMSDEEYRIYQAFRATGLTPNQVMKLVPEDAPAPMDLCTDDSNTGVYPTMKEFER